MNDRSPDSARTSELAALLAGAWRSGRPLAFDAAVAAAPDGEATAYAVQDAVAAALGWFPRGRPGAWKMGAPTRDDAPTAAPIPDAAVIAAPARLTDPAHTLIGIEIELALRLARPLPAGASRAEAAAAVGEVLAAIEVCDVRAERWAELPPLFRLADQQMNRWLILGTGVAGPWSDAFATAGVRLAVNGVERIRRIGGHPLEDPLFLLPWLASHAAARGAGLAAGDLITTGTWTGLVEARPGDRIHAAFAGIGEVSMEAAAR